jgi:hypothetical protein
MHISWRQRHKPLITILLTNLDKSCVLGGGTGNVVMVEYTS